MTQTGDTSSKKALPTLLVVDDEAGPRESLRLVFSGEYEVHLAMDAAEAMQIVKGRRMDVAILDIRMGGVSGIDLLKMLKEEDPGIEVIMLTAYETLETARQALRLGARDYISKPFDISSIREAVSRALHLRQVSDNISQTAARLHELTGQLQRASMREDISHTTNVIYAGVLHDINNPLTVISGYVDLLESQLARANTLEGRSLESTRTTIAHISKQVAMCSGIASRYMKTMRHTAENALPLSVNQVLADLEVLLSNHPCAKGGKLTVTPMEHDITIAINGSSFIQILLNLAINAFQAGTESPREVCISAGSTSAPVAVMASGPGELVEGEVPVGRSGAVVRITVTDRGGGIPPDILPSIFKPYFTTKDPNNGTGLGLAIVSRLVNEAHGAVHVSSRPGAGTTMTLFLPVIPPS